MEVSKIETFLTVAGRNLDRNFSFRITNPLNSTQKAASVSIKRAYQQANDIRISVGDKLYLSMSVNGGGSSPSSPAEGSGDKVLLFSGTVSSVGESSAYYRAEALFSALKAEALNETYRGISYKEAFAKLADKLEYRAEDASPEQIVLQGSPSESFNRLINSLAKALKKPVYYYLKRDNTLVITTEICSHGGERAERTGGASARPGGKEYTIDNMLFTAAGEKVNMFPIPELEIGDALQWGGQKKTVRGLVWDTTGRAEMVSNVMEYAPPKPKEKPKQARTETYKPASEESDYFVNPEKLKELAPGFKEHLVKLAGEVKQDMGEAYESIHITSAWRSKDRQIGILLEKLVQKPPKFNMYQYYAKTGISSKFLKIMQYLYDGQEVTEEDYQAIEDAFSEKGDSKYGAYCRKKFKEIIQANPIRAHSSDDVKQVLEISYKEKSLFNPSYHVSSVENQATAVDLKISRSTTKLLEKHNSADYSGYKNSGDTGDPHVHLTNRKVIKK